MYRIPYNNNFYTLKNGHGTTGHHLSFRETRQAEKGQNQQYNTPKHETRNYHTVLLTEHTLSPNSRHYPDASDYLFPE